MTEKIGLCCNWAMISRPSSCQQVVVITASYVYVILQAKESLIMKFSMYVMEHILQYIILDHISWLKFHIKILDSIDPQSYIIKNLMSVSLSWVDVSGP